MRVYSIPLLAFLTRFVKQYLHGGSPDSLDTEALKKEVEELRQRNSDLESQVAQLQAEVSKLCFIPASLLHFIFSLQSMQRDQRLVFCVCVFH